MYLHERGTVIPSFYQCLLIIIISLTIIITCSSALLSPCEISYIHLYHNVFVFSYRPVSIASYCITMSSVLEL